MSGISTHVLDTSSGLPAAAIQVELDHWRADAWHPCASSVTSSDGRCPDLLPPGEVRAGRYRLTFATAEYFARTATPALFTEITLTFTVAADNSSYHIPLLLNPFGYTTYRGT